jgi:hypothetical protein
VQGVAQPAQPTADVPPAEGLLDVGDDGQGGRRAARIRPGVGGVAVEENSQPLVTQVAAAELPQRRPRRHRAQVVEATCLSNQVAQALRGRLQKRPPGRHPHRVRPVEQAGPVGAGPGPQGVVEPPRQAGGGGIRGVHLDAVGKAVMTERVHRLEVEHGFQGRPGLAEQVAVDGRQREQRRPGVEGETVPGEGSQLAADRGRLLADRHGMAGAGETGGRRQPPHPCAHDDHPSHGGTLLVVVATAVAATAGSGRRRCGPPIAPGRRAVPSSAARRSGGGRATRP